MTNQKFTVLLQKKYGAVWGASTRLAKEIGVKNNTVSQWLNGVSRPTLALRAKVAQALGITLDDLAQIFDHQVKELNEINKPAVNLSLQGVKLVEKEILPRYGKVTSNNFRLANLPRGGTMELLSLPEGQRFELEVFGSGLEDYDLHDGEIVVLERQEWALEGEVVMVMVSPGIYHITSFGDNLKPRTKVFAVVREAYKRREIRGKAKA
jgi:transcriptional regulator with XRE-family HTH domain